MSFQETFVEAIKENEKIIFKVASIYARNKEDQEDLKQEIVLQLWKAFPTFKGQSKLSTWMYRVAINTAVTFIRKDSKVPQHHSIDEHAFLIPVVADTAFEDRIRLLYQHINHLNDLEKALILLYLEDKSHKEIAGIMGITVSNVGTRIARIKEKLRTNLGSTK